MFSVELIVQEQTPLMKMLPSGAHYLVESIKAMQIKCLTQIYKIGMAED